MIMTETSGRFTSARASRRSSVGVVASVGLPVVGLLPIALILITAGCGPPS